MTPGRTRASVLEWGQGFIAATAIGVLLGLLGPFGSFLNGGLWGRLVYWTGMAWLGFALCGGGVWLIVSRLRAPLAIWAALVTLIVVMSIPLGAVSWFAAHALWPPLNGLPRLTPAVWYVESLIVTAPQVMLFAVLALRRRDAGRSALLSAPSPGLLGVAAVQVLCLQMEDHYVRVHAAGASRLVLATLAQAIASLGRTPGLHVHRSWWVADAAVAGALRDGRNLRLVLTNGLKVPVARAKVAAARERGWLRDPGAAAQPEAPLGVAGL
jgi:hypothetical protein